MNFAKAEVSDLLKSLQRDSVFISEMQANVQAIFKLFNAENSYALKKKVYLWTNIWYYLMTSLCNLQTLGEEYAGILRIDSAYKIPGKTLHTLWLILYLGGESLFDKSIKLLKEKIHKNPELRDDAKNALNNTLDFINNNKVNFKRIHYYLFYIDGRYYNVSNRITGIKYVLVRKWMKDNTFAKSFRTLGYLSLFYTLFDMLQQTISKDNNKDNTEEVIAIQSTRKYCSLCTEIQKKPCATSCGHVFCWNCINDSLNYQKTCPICREIVYPNRVIFLQNYC